MFQLLGYNKPIIGEKRRQLAKRGKYSKSMALQENQFLRKQGLEYIGFLDSGEAEVETLKLECEFLVIHAQ